MQSQAPRQIKTILGANLRRARDLRGWSQGRLAAELGGWDSTSISRWENGRVRISDDNLVALARVLEQDIAWFYVDRALDEAA